MSDELTKALADLEEQKVESLVDERLAAGIEPSLILAACQGGMRQVGERYEAGEYFVSDLMMSSAIFRKVVARLEPLLVGTTAVSRGSVVIGTVKGDIHDIGKDLVVSTLRASGYTVTDLGVNVPPERLVEALEETGATVLALSGLAHHLVRPHEGDGRSCGGGRSSGSREDHAGWRPGDRTGACVCRRRRAGRRSAERRQAGRRVDQGGVTMEPTCRFDQ